MSLEELRNPNTDGSLCSVTSDLWNLELREPSMLGSRGLLVLLSPKPLLRRAYLRRDITEGTISLAQDSGPRALLVPISLNIVR